MSSKRQCRSFICDSIASWQGSQRAHYIALAQYEDRTPRLPVERWKAKRGK